MNNVPVWLKPGALVEFAYCVGQVMDIAVSADRIMVLVRSPKGIWRNHPAEWLEYQPEAIKPATLERAARDLELYREYIVKMLAEIDGLGAEWLASDNREAASEASTPAGYPPSG